MKNKILTFIIGLLVGAILATGGFLIYEQSKSSEDSDTNVNDFEGRPQMPNGENFNGGTPPDMNNMDSNSIPQRPDGSSSQMPQRSEENTSSDNTTNTPPEKPADDSRTNMTPEMPSNDNNTSNESNS